MDLLNNIADGVKSGVEKVKNTLSGTNDAAQSSLPAIATAKAPATLGTAPETPGYTATGGRRIKRRRTHKKTRRGGGENAYGFAPMQIRRPGTSKGGRRTRRGGYTYIPLSGPNDGRIGFGPMQIRKRGGRRTKRRSHRKH